MTRTKKTIAWAAACFAAVLLYDGGFLLFADPGDAARAKAVELGWERDDMVVLSGGYSSTLVSWSSFLRFRSKSQPASGEVFVAVRKPTPLHPWELAEYTREAR